MSQPLLLIEKKNKVGILTLNRPSKGNALNTQLKRDLLKALDDLSQDPEVGAVLLMRAEWQDRDPVGALFRRKLCGVLDKPTPWGSHLASLDDLGYDRRHTVGPLPTRQAASGWGE